MSEKKELNNEQLEKVTGGKSWAEQMSEYLPSNHGVHINQYEAENHKNEKVYAVRDGNPYNWFFGTLIDSYEGSHDRFHVIYVEDMHGNYLFMHEYSIGQTLTLKGNCHTLFLK